MWILNDSQVITSPRGITVNNVQHPETIFRLWSKEELAAIGIKPFHPAVVNQGERVVSSTREERDGEFYEIVTTEPIPDTRTYAEKRAAEYPSLAELDIALWEKVMEGRPEAAEALQAKRQAIKAKYPKA